MDSNARVTKPPAAPAILPDLLICLALPFLPISNPTLKTSIDLDQESTKQETNSKSPNLNRRANHTKQISSRRTGSNAISNKKGKCKKSVVYPMISSLGENSNDSIETSRMPRRRSKRPRQLRINWFGDLFRRPRLAWRWVDFFLRSLVRCVKWASFSIRIWPLMFIHITIFACDCFMNFTIGPPNFEAMVHWFELSLVSVMSPWSLFLYKIETSVVFVWDLTPDLTWSWFSQ